MHSNRFTRGRGLNESGDNGDIARLDQSPVRADSRRRSWPRVKVHQTMGLNESGNNGDIAKGLEMTGGVCLEDLRIQFRRLLYSHWRNRLPP
jgi:hypothetical protein